MAPFILINSKMIISSLIISLSLMNCYVLLQGTKMVESAFEYVTFDVSSLLSTSCKSSLLQDPASRPGLLKVTHMYGPCSKLSQLDENVPSLSEVLSSDEFHVASIQNRNTFNTKSDKLDSSKTTVPAKSGMGTGNYVVSVSLGTPAKNFTLIFDTASSITWTQCKPCVGHCYEQNEPIFDPLASSSYKNISCNSAQCSKVYNATGNPATCLTSTCIYGLQYGDGSISAGFLAKEKLTLTPHDVFKNFLFGCGENNQGLFGNSAGLLGLGRESLSMVSQTGKKYGKYFSYCLPTKSGSNGHLTFGKYQAPRNLVFTPLITSTSPNRSSSFYYINTIAISVGGRQLPISPSVFQSGGTIIDSGTVITRLAPTAYTTFRDAFRQEMSKYPLAPAFSVLDTCYDFNNHTTITVPKISFIFTGNAKVDLGFKGILLAVNQSQICLAFAANNADTDMGIFANVQQQTFEVAYDVAAGRIGFGPASCS